MLYIQIEGWLVLQQINRACGNPSCPSIPASHPLVAGSLRGTELSQECAGDGVERLPQRVCPPEEAELEENYH